MKSECDRFRAVIPMSLVGDIAPKEQEELSLHLADCRPCSDEYRLYTGALDQLRATEDVPVPRHFFIYPTESKMGLRQLLRQVSLPWQVALATAALAMGIFTVMAAAKMQIKASDGVLMVAFGKPAEPQIHVPPQPSLDVQALEGRIIQAVAERDRKEQLEWVRSLRNEVSKSQRQMTLKQRKEMDSALAALEARVGHTITATALELENKTGLSLAEMYQAVSQQRQRDLTNINARFTRLAVAGETKSNQTDAILETLLQVAESRMK